MDPVSHAVIGRAVAAAVYPRGADERGVASAAILGALSPDVDLLLIPAGWDVYLRAHVIGTHALIGALIAGAGSGLIVGMMVRRGSLSKLIVAGALAACSHLLGDLAAGARLRLGWPLDSTIVSAPLVAMGDPWTIAILLAGAIVMWRMRDGRRRAARATLVALALFLAIKGILLAQILSGPGASSLVSQPSRIVDARWGSLTEWHLFDRTPETVRRWSVKVGDHEPRLLMAVVEARESPLVRSSRALQSVRNFFAVHELGFAREESEAGAPAVMWSDIRYCWRDDATRESRCALWFGGVFDRAGRAVTQEVRVGAWIQRRAP